MECPAEEVTAYVDGALAGAARARVERHLRGACPACAAQVEEEREVRRRLRSLSAAVPSPAFVRRVGAPWGALVMAAAFALLYALFTPEPASLPPGFH